MTLLQLEFRYSCVRYNRTPLYDHGRAGRKIIVHSGLVGIFDWNLTKISFGGRGSRSSKLGLFPIPTKVT